MSSFHQGPKVGDLVLFDITWADITWTDTYETSDKYERMQYAMVTQVRKRSRHHQYILEWNGEDVLFFGSLDRIKIIGD